MHLLASPSQVGGLPDPGWVVDLVQVVAPTVWASAHTTQFVQLGWKMLHSGSGDLKGGGSYVTMVSPSGDAFSVIIETGMAECHHCPANNANSTAAAVPQTLAVTLCGPLVAHTSLSVWLSDETHEFEQQPNATVSDGKLTVTVPPNAVMTITSTTGQKKGHFPAAPAASAAFPSSYRDDFDSSPPESLAKYWADQCGSFQVMPAGGGRSGHSLLQRVTEHPGVNKWANNLDNPTTVLGNPTATGDSTIRVDVRVPEAAFGPWHQRSVTPTFEYHHGQINGGQWKIDKTAITFEEAKALCIQTQECQALTFKSITPEPPVGQKADIWLTSLRKVDAKSTGWQSYLLTPPHPPPPPPIALGVGVCGRVTKANWPAVCLLLSVDPASPSDTLWRIADAAATNVVANGTLSGFSLSTWHSVELAFAGGRVTASVDGKELGSAATGETRGMVELQTGWHVAEFDNFELTASAMA